MKIAWFTAGLLWLAFFLNYVDRQAAFSIFPVLARDLRFSNAQLGLIGTVFLWSYSLSMPFAGRLADVLRRDRLAASSVALWSLATLGTASSGSAAAFLCWRAVTGISEALFMPAALGLLAVWHSGDTRSRALSLFATGQFAGIAAGGWYGGWMAGHIGWRVGYASLAIAGVGYAIVLGAVVRRPPAGPGPPKQNAAPRDVLESRTYLALSAAFFAFCFVLWVLLAWLANFLYERFHLSLADSGLRATLFLQAGTAAGVLAGGILGDAIAVRFPGGRFYLGGTGLLFCAPFAYAMLDLGALPLLELCCIAFGFFGGLFIANLYSSAYDVVAERNYGFAAGALNMLGGAAGGAAVFLNGLVKASLGMAGLLRLGAVATAVGAIILITITAACFRSDHAAEL